MAPGEEPPNAEKTEGHQDTTGMAVNPSKEVTASLSGQETDEERRLR